MTRNSTPASICWAFRSTRKILSSKKPTTWDIFEQGTKTPGAKSSVLKAADVISANRTFYSGQSPTGGRIDVIPSRLELAYSLKNPGQNKERRLQKILAEVEDQYDLILIDCAPTESVLTTAAYLSSDWLLVPVKPEYLSTIGLPLLVNSMQDFKSEYDKSKLELAGVVFNAASNYFPEEAHAKSTVRAIAKKNNWYVFSHGVSYSRSYPKGAREGMPISRTSYSRGTQVANFALFAEEFAQRVGL